MRDVRRTTTRTWEELKHFVPALKNWIGMVLFGSLAYLSYLEDAKLLYISIGLVVLALIVAVNALVVTRQELP